MGLHEIKKFLHNKRNGFAIEEANPQNERKSLAAINLTREQITRVYGKLKKLNSPKINDPMKKWANELNRAFFQRKKFKWLKKNT
jgi:hypothetical protein